MRAERLKSISFEWNRDPQSWHERFRREMINLDTFLNVTVLPYQDLLAIALLHFLAPSILRLVLQRLEFVSSKDDKDLTVEAMFDWLIAHSEPLRLSMEVRSRRRLVMRMQHRSKRL